MTFMQGGGAPSLVVKVVIGRSLVAEFVALLVNITRNLMINNDVVIPAEREPFPQLGVFAGFARLVSTSVVVVGVVGLNKDAPAVLFQGSAVAGCDVETVTCDTISNGFV